MKFVGLVVMIVFLVSCSSKPIVEDVIHPLELAIVFDGAAEYASVDIVNVSVFVMNNVHASYRMSMELWKDGSIDYNWSEDHTKLISDVERWNVWKSYLSPGDWLLVARASLLDGSFSAEQNASFMVR